jgi:uncharacterized protein YndB with AHSA1/START domain
MNQNLIANASVTINAPREKVWKALVDPEAIPQYMFGAQVVTDWQIGHPIVWRGEWKGKPYEDRGRILKLESGRLIQYSHFSPLSGREDRLENYHTVTIEVSGDGNLTTVSLNQDRNESETARRHSEDNWKMMLEALKKYVET